MGDVEKVKDFQSVIQKSVDLLYNSLFLKNAFFVLYSDETRKYELNYQSSAILPLWELDIEPGKGVEFEIFLNIAA